MADESLRPDAALIARNYLRGPFPLDLFSCLPLDVLAAGAPGGVRGARARDFFFAVMPSEAARGAASRLFPPPDGPV